jgi:excisionase family DNA binding protein
MPSLERVSRSDVCDGHGTWLTSERAREYVGLPSKKALYQAVRRGQLPAHRLGRRLRFNRAELDEALARG